MVSNCSHVNKSDLSKLNKDLQKKIQILEMRNQKQTVEIEKINERYLVLIKELKSSKKKVIRRVLLTQLMKKPCIAKFLKLLRRSR